MLRQQKRKREDHEMEDERPFKRTRDVGLIAGHCASQNVSLRFSRVDNIRR
jgi:hypothetical protein